MSKITLCPFSNNEINFQESNKIDQPEIREDIVSSKMNENSNNKNEQNGS